MEHQIEIPLKSFLHSKYIEISLESAKELEGYNHAAHCCIYAINSELVNKKYPAKAAVLMQNRFDGALGFPGGMADKENCIVTGLNRELQEEMNLNLSRFAVKEEDHIITHHCAQDKMCYHFFQKQVSLEEFKSIEKDTLDAEEYGNETFGILRVPLFIRRDGFGGLPTFLGNVFAGNACYQLLYFLIHCNILTAGELNNMIEIFKKNQSRKKENSP